MTFSAAVDEALDAIDKLGVSLRECAAQLRPETAAVCDGTSLPPPPPPVVVPPQVAEVPEARTLRHRTSVFYASQCVYVSAWTHGAAGDRMTDGLSVTLLLHPDDARTLAEEIRRALDTARLS